MEQNKSQSQTSPLHPPTSDANSQFTILALILLLALYLATAFAYAALAPLTTGPDELAHYEYVRFIAGHGRLPVNNEERAQASYKSDQPPLYHLLAALPAALVDPTGPPTPQNRVGDTPRRQLIERTRHAWGLYNTEDERWPYRAEILAWHTGRWVAILFGAGTVLVTFFTTREVFARTGQRLSEAVAQPPSNLPTFQPSNLPLLAVAVVAFIPRFGLTGAMLNYETTVAFFSALFLWVLLRIANSEWRIQRSTFNVQRSTFNALLLGFFAGLAILSKLSAVILLPEIIIALWLIARAAKAQNASRITHHAFRHSLLALAAALSVLSLWFGFVLYHFNTVAQDGLWVGLLRPLIAADSSDATTNQLLSLLTGGEAGFTGAIENLESGPPWQWAATMFRTFWMVGIETVQPLAGVAPALALAFCLLAAYGLISITADRRPPTADRGASGLATQPPISNLQSPISYPRLLLSLLALHLFMPLLLPLLRYAVTFSLADTAQGRHVLFLGAPAFAILLIWGIEAALSRISIRQRDREAEARQAKARRLLRRKSASAFTRLSLWLTDHLSAFSLQASRLTPHASRLIPLLSALLLLVWTAAHLWAMTWAYLPPLPVSTLPEAKAQAAQTLNTPLNKFVTLTGYTSHLDPAGRTLRLDLIWQATAFSPTDYLTEVSLLDSAGRPQAQWLGYTAGGRYPTRAWDVGDIVRDTIWLPIEGLAAGDYELSLNLIPTSGHYPAGAGVMPLTLTRLTLPDTALRTFNNSLVFADQAAAAAGYSVWQDGQALTVLREFRYRETVLVSLSPLLPDQQREVRLVGPAGSLSFAPLRELNNTVLFIVGPDWASGKYHLQVTMTSPAAGEQQVNSSAVLTVVDRWQRQFTEPPMAKRVEANFADQVKLLSYTLGANRAEPGGGIPLTLVWQGLDWLGSDYTIFTKLIKADDQTVHGGRDRLPQEGYHTLYWAPGEIVTDAFGVPVQADAPPGVYYLHVGLYQQVGRQAVSLPLVQDGQPVDATAVIIGPVKVGGPPPGVTLTTTKPQTQVNQPFGDGPNVTLLGYDLGGNNCQQTAKCQLSVTFYWRSEAPLPVDYTTFIHVRNVAGETVAQQDQPPLNGAYPTSLWDSGEIIADPVMLALPADLPPGKYSVVVGLYDFYTGQRLTVPGAADNELLLEDITF
ncbi:MAG: glycosyltransferase family 39 protein [Anaerolineales bacterium]|nr:glycosyltransferase family 39 protein [Anaerolineales bacterium]